MLKNSIIIGFILCLFSCSNNKKDEVVDFSDITKSSNRYKEGKVDLKSVEKRVDNYDSLNLTLKNFIDSLELNKQSIQIVHQTDFIDRFENNFSQKIKILLGDDTLSIYYWEYKDSTQTMNVFYNWLDINKLVLFEASKMKGEPFKLLVYSNKIIKFKSLKMVENELILKGFDEGFAFKFYIDKNNRNKLKWFNVENEKLIELKK